jgi:prepilin-type N-terminal cleavage/methylation domain-containing protein
MVATPPIRQHPDATIRQYLGVIQSAAKNPRILFKAPQPSQTPNPAPCTLSPAPCPASGFTLLELMIVMVVIGLLAAIAIPAYTSNIRNAKEAVLKEDLHTMRQAIDSYTVDKAKAGSPSRRTPTSASTRPKPASTTSTAEPSRPPPTAPPTTPGNTSPNEAIHCLKSKRATKELHFPHHSSNMQL